MALYWFTDYQTCKERIWQKAQKIRENLIKKIAMHAYRNQPFQNIIEL